MNPNPMTNAGRPPDVQDHEITTILEDTTDPVLFTAEIADQLPIGQRATKKRLDQLATNGKIQTKSSGDRCAVYWI